MYMNGEMIPFLRSSEQAADLTTQNKTLQQKVSDLLSRIVFASKMTDNEIPYGWMS